jgi:hypothetical protein
MSEQGQALEAFLLLKMFDASLSRLEVKLTNL